MGDMLRCSISIPQLRYAQQPPLGKGGYKTPGFTEVSPGVFFDYWDNLAVSAALSSLTLRKYRRISMVISMKFST